MINTPAVPIVRHMLRDGHYLYMEYHCYHLLFHFWSDNQNVTGYKDVVRIHTDHADGVYSLPKWVWCSV